MKRRAVIFVIIYFFYLISDSIFTMVSSYFLCAGFTSSANLRSAISRLGRFNSCKDIFLKDSVPSRWSNTSEKKDAGILLSTESLMQRMWVNVAFGDNSLIAPINTSLSVSTANIPLLNSSSFSDRSTIWSEHFITPRRHIGDRI